MQNIRVGFIGAGSHSGRRLYPSLRAAGLDLVAVCDRHLDKATARAAEYSVERIYTDYREMCEREQLEAVLVSVRPQVHYELSLALLERGYHVWLEKPCAATAAQADEIARGAAKAGRLVQIGFNYRYSLGVRKALSLIEGGRFAAPALVAVRWWLGVPDPIQFWHHFMVHGVDLLGYLTGADLTGMQVAHLQRDGFDYYEVTFAPTGGCLPVLELTANMNIAGHWSRVDLMSKDGMLSVSDFTEVTHYTSGPWGRFAPPDAPAWDGDRVWRTEPLIGKEGFIEAWGYVHELDLFRQAVIGQHEPVCTIAEAARGMHVCEDILKTAGYRLE